MSDDLTVTEAAEALGTSAQTVRALLRKGELRGRRQAWGTRYVWVPSQKGVDEFLSQHGRLDGRRRRRRPSVARPAGNGRDVSTAGSVDAPGITETLDAPTITAPRAPRRPRPEPYRYIGVDTPPDSRPFFLRPRGRATVVVVVLGVPLLLAYVAAGILPDALWFDELGQLDVFRRMLAARIEFHLLGTAAVALIVGLNLKVALRGTGIATTPAGALGLTAVSLFTGSMFASSAEAHWQTFLLWWHRQPFGVVDPIHGKDIGFYVFSLPFELLVNGLLLWLVAISAVYVILVYGARAEITFRPLQATYRAQLHLAALAAAFLLVLAWRLQLQRYTLELGQPGPSGSRSFAGASYVDVHIRSPGFAALSAFAVILASVCVLAPEASRSWHGRRAMRFAGALAAVFGVSVIFVSSFLPALVQRYVVDPNPLLSEQRFLSASITATRRGLGLDQTELVPYSPTGAFSPDDVSSLGDRLRNTLIWETWLLQARMRQLVTDTPYYDPDEAIFDVVPVARRRQPTVASARELDIRRVRSAGTWINDRLSYTHGLGVVRFSGTDIQSSRQPRLLDAGLGIRQPRIYFGDLPSGAPSWVIAASRRPEVDVPTADGAPDTPYHYDGSAGITLSSWLPRVVFALELGSKELLLSDDITSKSRLLLHRDVRDRLRTLAPFIKWDRDLVPLTVNGRIVFLVQGYTTSNNYPYAERVDLGEASVNYARASVRATVDAFTGRVDIYLTDESDPIARAWAEAFPTLFRPKEGIPAELRDRLRYPADLFAAQATAYERFHTTQPNRFASEADVWSRPIGLSGPVEVAGDIDFDESDEDELRARMEPGYKFSPPPGRTRPRLLLETYYSPRRGQNLVASLTGWIDGQGRPRLAARNLPREQVTLGPAQVSRLVFATPRVRNLLGLRNLEIRDLDKSSLDNVILGEPHLSFQPGGIVQIQPLYEGSRGPGAARLLGVTAFLKGRAGLAPDIYGAVRQALNKPPRIDVLRPSGTIFVGTPVELRFDVANAQSQVMTISSPAGRQAVDLSLRAGRGTVIWVPSAPGQTRVRVAVNGLDGSLVADTTTFSVLSPPPTLRLTSSPTRAVVGQPLRVSFEAANALDVIAEVSTRAGVEFTRRYLVRNGSGLVEWTPRTAGPAELVIRARGRQGQIARETLRITVEAGPRKMPPPDHHAPQGAGRGDRRAACPVRIPSRRLRGCGRTDRGPERERARLAIPLPRRQRRVYVDSESPRTLLPNRRRSRRRDHHSGCETCDRGARAMTTGLLPSGPGDAWVRHLSMAAGCAAGGVLVHLASPFLPVQLAMFGLGMGVVGAAFLLAWAADAGEAVFSGGLVLAAVALVAVLPEFIIELRFAYIQETGLVTANLTGATRLLLTGATAMPLIVVYIARRRLQAVTTFQLAANRRLELAILLVAAIFAVQIVVRGSLTVIDGVVLVALYVLYARRVQGTQGEEPAVVGVPAGLLSLPPQYRRPAIVALIVVAGAVVITIANPFADALLATGTWLGIDPYHLIQSVVPVASESPEFVVVAVLVANRRPAQGLAVFLASSVSQWTLALGALPFAYLAGGGGTSMPLAGRELVELTFTIALTLFVVAALSVLRPERFDAWLVIGIFAIQFIYPDPFVRSAAAFVFFVFAIDLFVAHRRAVPPLFRTAFGGFRSGAQT